MSFTGRVEEKCPGCSETEEHEIWSFVRGDQDEVLQGRVKSGDLNVLECPHCGRLFNPGAAWIYADAREDLVAFVFPEAFEQDEAAWRGKMKEDFERMRPVAEKMGLREEPGVFFGAEGLARLLRHLDDLEDECEVAQWFCKKLELSMRPVKASFARERDLPRRLAYVATQGRFTREGALSGLRALLQTNDRLLGYRRWLEYFEKGGEDPPFPGKG